MALHKMQIVCQHCGRVVGLEMDGRPLAHSVVGIGNCPGTGYVAIAIEEV